MTPATEKKIAAIRSELDGKSGAAQISILMARVAELMAIEEQTRAVLAKIVKDWDGEPEDMADARAIVERLL